MKLEDLTEAFIKQFAGGTIYGRGLDYYESERVSEFDYDPAEDAISAEVVGNYDDYEVGIASEQSGIDADCDCPYDGYPCKHIVAVLLTFLHSRDELDRIASEQRKDVASLKGRIKVLSKDELVEIILDCANKYADFKRELTVRFEADKKTTWSTIFKQIEKAFPPIQSRSYSTSSIASQLRTILKSAENAPDDVSAGLYWAVADRVLAELSEYGMDDSSLESVADNALQLLSECLGDNQALGQQKQEIIGELMDYYTRRNCGMVDQIYDTVLELCSENSDYQIVIDRLEAYVEKATSGSYHRNLLAHLYGAIGDTESQLRTLENNLQYGMDYWRLAKYWIEKGDKDRALRIVQDGLQEGEGRRTELYVFLQQHYVDKDDYDGISRLLETKAQKSDLGFHGTFKDDPTYQCLWQHYKSRKDYHGQVELLELRFTNNDIGLDLYKEAEGTLNKTDWPPFEKRIIGQLEDSIRERKASMPWAWVQPREEMNALAEVYVYKKDMEKLLEAVVDEHSLLVKYEAKLLPLYPLVYLEQYRSTIERLIGLRGRENYKDAATFARAVKNIYEKILKEPGEWRGYISRLRNDNKRLRALQEELDAL